jgi:CarD family transcriptional regulator
MTYRVNDTVLYGAQGVCKIAEISEKNLRGQSTEYYVLKPIYDTRATIFVPVNNEQASANMRPVISVEQIHALIDTMPDTASIWIEDEGARRFRYQEILAGGDRLELIKLIKTLHTRRQMQKNKGKELHIGDKHLLKDAEKMLHEEFAYVLNIQCEQVLPFILEQIEPGKREQI